MCCSGFFVGAKFKESCAFLLKRTHTKINEKLLKFPIQAYSLEEVVFHYNFVVFLERTNYSILRL